MERPQHERQADTHPLPGPGAPSPGETPAREGVRVYRVVIIKDGEFVQPAGEEPARQATAC
jgi:hypothetical protein